MKNSVLHKKHLALNRFRPFEQTRQARSTILACIVLFGLQEHNHLPSLSQELGGRKEKPQKLLAACPTQLQAVPRSRSEMNPKVSGPSLPITVLMTSYYLSPKLDK